MSNTQTNLDEYDAIAKTVQSYINGARSGKGDDMKPAFHEGATIFGYAGDDLFSGPIQIDSVVCGACDSGHRSL